MSNETKESKYTHIESNGRNSQLLIEIFPQNQNRNHSGTIQKFKPIGSALHPQILSPVILYQLYHMHDS